jgi:hypothetical protein
LDSLGLFSIPERLSIFGGSMKIASSREKVSKVRLIFSAARSRHYLEADWK